MTTTRLFVPVLFIASLALAAGCGRDTYPVADIQIDFGCIESDDTMTPYGRAAPNAAQLVYELELHVRPKAACKKLWITKVKWEVKTTIDALGLWALYGGAGATVTLDQGMVETDEIKADFALPLGLDERKRLLLALDTTRARATNTLSIRRKAVEWAIGGDTVVSYQDNSVTPYKTFTF